MTAVSTRKIRIANGDANQPGRAATEVTRYRAGGGGGMEFGRGGGSADRRDMAGFGGRRVERAGAGNDRYGGAAVALAVGIDLRGALGPKRFKNRQLARCLDKAANGEVDRDRAGILRFAGERFMRHHGRTARIAMRRCLDAHGDGASGDRLSRDAAGQDPWESAVPFWSSCCSDEIPAAACELPMAARSSDPFGDDPPYSEAANRSVSTGPTPERSSGTRWTCRRRHPGPRRSVRESDPVPRWEVLRGRADVPGGGRTGCAATSWMWKRRAFDFLRSGRARSEWFNLHVITVP